MATGLGSGYAPFAPGTAGTVVAVPLYLVFSPLSWPLYLITTAAFTALAVLVSQEAEKLFGRKDAQCIVIDEVAGYLWTLFLVVPTIPHVLAAFVLFRFFDIVKIFPAGVIQRLPGGYGVVADDVVAGLYANLTLGLMIRYWGL
jgi:phosphatidylglycerophosphatase A